VCSVDTATEILAVALLRDGQVRGRRQADQSIGSQARELLPMITDLLRVEGAELAEVTGWVVSRGPGSFTGIRIGLSTVRALAWARGVPVYGACTLDALACGARLPGGAPALVLLDARKAEVYAAAYVGGPDGPLPVGPPRLVKPERAATLLPAGDQPVMVLGRGLRRYRDAVVGGLAGRPRVELDEPFDLPDAVCLAQAVALRGQGEAGDDPLDPIYLRKPEAEEKWEAARAAAASEASAR